MKKPLHNVVRFFLRIWLLILFFIGYNAAYSQTLDYGKTYVNKTKGTSGGTIEPGDTLQIRTTIVVNSSLGTIDSCGFYDTIPVGAVYVPGTLRILTNEGKIWKSFTDALTDDPGKIVSNQFITINMGYTSTLKTATASRRGQMRNTDKPTLWGSTCVMVASYEMIVTAAYGATVNVGGGKFTYKYSGSLKNVFFDLDNAAVFKNTGICENTVGGNAIGMEYGGSFGSGKPRNRGASSAISGTYQFRTFTTGTPNDYYYGVANNTSTEAYTTSNAWAKPDNTTPTTHRVFGVWDIIGDHTGAADPYAGNPAADTVANTNAGYMMVVNASYKTDYAFQYTVTNLCPNTYYEISSWLYNICSKCGADSLGRGPSSAGYIPTGPQDSSGVHPNLTYQLNGVDYYTTGDISYSGKWIKKAFTYLTGPSQTSFTLTIRNNAPGGGGNDWAIDDISVATCTPNLDMQPTGNAKVCYGNQVDLSCVVSSYFPNYTYWQWEKSVDKGSTWAVDTANIGTVQNVNGKYEYRIGHRPFFGDSTSNGNIYRLRIATSPENLSNENCSFIASTTIMVYVNNCSHVLQTSLLNFNGILNSKNFGQIVWTSGTESAQTKFTLEKSFDNIHYSPIAVVNGKGVNGTGASYSFTDPNILDQPAYYRLKVQDGVQFSYSKSIILSPVGLHFDVQSVLNPFSNSISFNAVSPLDGNIKVSVFDYNGRLLKTEDVKVIKGLTNVTINDLNNLPNGVYALRVEYKNLMVIKRVIKVAK
ncbi:T9SS type A sorting domain-containing protein [Chitinophagaceae bacterium 26-R-25]|nr:T9SS type A sorting domain-containing protein [Chitinophagaceae bacterium 26-R-25]